MHAISPTREENYPEWYQQVVKEADLAENSEVRGCMVIKPWGYGIWENIQRILNHKIKETGCQNAYFPLFIPLSLFQKEADHVEGFAKECAIVTHSKLEKNAEGKLIPKGELEEPLIVRPTSEMIIGQSFAKWVSSYRDLPLIINQWANIVRWEMRTRLFLRTAEFLWQEGHTVHASEKEAQEETLLMLNVYQDFLHQYLAMPVIKGEKTESERFPGAVNTYSNEAMMQDKKALQACTSHFLGQNFARSCDIQFTDENGKVQHGWTTSWGATTRLIGGLVMTHSDDDGLILPPRIAPAQIVILPVIHSEEAKSSVLHYCDRLAQELKQIDYQGQKLQVIIDTSDKRGGEKKWKWIKKGVPLRIEIGPRDIEKNLLPVMKRDDLISKPLFISKENLLNEVIEILEGMQKGLFAKSHSFLKKNTVNIENEKDFFSFFEEKEKGTSGGFALVHYASDEKVEKMLKEKYSVTPRCMPLEEKGKTGKCIFTGRPSSGRVIFAKSY